jgi:aspartate/methionine/tyrosine aminotransferase
MHPLAREINEALDGTIVAAMLSDVGRRMFFPKGIVAQATEATREATRFNATVGMSTSKGQPMHLSDIYNKFDTDAFTPSQIFAYAPGGGDATLRTLWLEEMLEKNPTLRGKRISAPLVTAGLTHGLSIIAQLFFGEGDTLVLPDLAWDNYELIFAHQQGGELATFPLYNAEGGFNVEGLRKTISSVAADEVRLLLNFPNNPTGYTPTVEEMAAIVDVLVEAAEGGKKLLVITDDAYFGLFFEEKVEPQSLFSYLCDAHPNIFAVKCDAATKEELVWGFRIGFVTYGAKGLTDEHYDALNRRTLGIIRSTVSNCDRPGQSLLVKAMTEGKNYRADKEGVFAEMKQRYTILREALKPYRESDLLIPHPFNSGYFMAFKTKGSAEELRVHLLKKYQIGCINIADVTLRLAYCSVEYEKVGELVDLVYAAAHELWS